MKILIVVMGLLAWIGCHDESKVLNEEVFEADATWVNMLAADGCSWHFSVVSGDSTLSFIPDEGSQQKIDKELGKLTDYYSFTDVHLKYSKTGNKGTILCGWGKHATYDEIKVIDIHKK
ncbi:hypothetical protein [Dyadobacter arcticus]|uniref:Uncharacterized protein n=1 Tax=Dyadobacter arcticus TaxID=1078754 RepID=A0ABX0UJF9_9BACT|nr:hypothetical protein [Dyadobacter arcticus]NIJ51835.1 hypothetical protein [Dyadobacter arcticus]